MSAFSSTALPSPEWPHDLAMDVLRSENSFDTGEDRVKVSIARDKEETIYEIVLPWPTLGTFESLATRLCIGFSLTINDADKNKPERKGLRLFHGIVNTKDPEQYGNYGCGKFRKEQWVSELLVRFGFSICAKGLIATFMFTSYIALGLPEDCLLFKNRGTSPGPPPLSFLP